MMSSLRLVLLRSWKKHLTSRSAPMATSSSIDPARVGIWTTFIADIPDLKS
jgi:hypothetical protein